jgi:AcrR family transcriptional regulator
MLLSRFVARPPTDRGIVLDATRRVVLERGVRDARVDLIATESGVSRATVYRTIGGRDELVEALLLQEAEALFDVVGTAIDGASNGFDVVRTGVKAALRVIDERPVLRRIATKDLDHVLAALTTRSRGLIAAAVEILAPILESARRRGALPAATDVHFLSEELIRYVIALLHTPTLDGSSGDPVRASERATRLFSFWLDAVATAGAATASAATSGQEGGDRTALVEL